VPQVEKSTDKTAGLKAKQLGVRQNRSTPLLVKDDTTIPKQRECKVVWQCKVATIILFPERESSLEENRNEALEIKENFTSATNRNQPHSFY